MTTTARFLGTTDDVTNCDCCGRTGLKSTVALLVGEDALEPVYYGVTCAAKALGMRAPEVRKAAKAADDAREAAERAKREEEQRAQSAVWFAWLDSKVPELRGDAFRQLEKLGGYRVARAAFKAEQGAA